MSPPSAEGTAATLLEALASAARRAPSKTALRRGADALTYDGLLREIDERAARISARKGWIALDASDPVAFVAGLFAARAAGRGAIAHGAQVPALLRERREALLAGWRAAEGVEATVFFSSGSVGDGRAIPLGDRPLLAAATGYPRPPEIVETDRVAVGVSTAHVFGLVRGTLHPLILGAEVVFFSPRRDPLAEAEALGATVALLAGPHVKLAARSSRRTRLRAVFSGGGSIPEEAVAAVEQRRGVPVRLGYGLTESAGLGSRQRLSERRRPGTSGRPAAGLAVSIVDPETGADLPPGETGEIRLAGDSVFSGYAGPSAADPFDGRGRLATGDLGYFDDQGELVVRGRREFSLVIQGRTVCAEEIEMAIAEHPSVSDVAVSPDDDGFAVLFVPNENEPGGVETVREFVQLRLPAFARPRKVVSVESLPRNSSGKLDRRIVSSWLA
ncbi:MAG TPA: fatty acid--CoA ligase family protein [Thermoanaerobaculia bacterium]|nr:fatty acid--CoA ligase family protein [Thermoanaerobaculia bacterium]